MKNIDEQKHIVWAIAIGFIAPVFIQILSALLWPPDFSGDVPHYDPNSLIGSEIAVALMIFGSTLMGIKLADEKRVMPSAGFTMLAIANGVIFVIFFELISQMNEESMAKGYTMLIGATILQLPALFLISFYHKFPRWVNWLAMLSNAPTLTACILFYRGDRNYDKMEFINLSGYLMFAASQVCWGVFVLKEFYKKRKGEKISG